MVSTTEGYELNFPAIRGTQAGKEYYIAMCPVNIAVKIISTCEDHDIPAELRAQRALNKSRIPALTDYVLNNRHSYAFSSLTVSVDSQVDFIPHGKGAVDRNLGLLKVPYGVTYLVNDGQHRRAALEAAMKEDPSLKDEHISLVIYVDQGLERSQQLFADLNRYVVRPTTSLSILYDHRDPLSKTMVAVVEQIELFAILTEKEKTSISNRSIKLFTLSVLYQATAELLRKKKGQRVTKDDLESAVNYWNSVVANMKDWQLAAAREISSAELRKDTVHAHGIILRAFGRLGVTLISKPPAQWKITLKKLKSIDWSKTANKAWVGRAITSTGRISKSANNITLTTNYIKSCLDVELSPEEEAVEEEFKASI